MRKRVQTVIITVEGGVAHLFRKPRGVRVIIRDYDVEAQDEYQQSRLKVDTDGASFAEATFEPDGTARGLSLDEGRE